MNRAAMRGISCWAFIMLGIVTTQALAQHGGGATSSLPVNTVPLGHIVELQLSVRVPVGRTVYFPVKLPTSRSFESHGPVRWKAEPAPNGTILKLTYPLLAFGIGRVQVPGIDILMRPMDRSRAGTTLPGGFTIGAWDEAPTPAPSSTLARFPPREMRVASLFELEGVLGGVGPTPAADVVGPSVGLAPLALLAVSALMFSGALVVVSLRLRSRVGGPQGKARRQPPRDGGPSAAIQELDDLLARGLQNNGQMRAFYTRTSEIVRRHVEQFDPNWGPNLTSAELMQGLEAQVSGRQVDVLSTEMGCAEVMKFGHTRSDAAAAETHWRSVRDWLQGSERKDL